MDYDIKETGTYRFRVKAGLNSTDKDYNTGVVSDYSPEFHYVRPSKQLPTPTNLKWDPSQPGTK
ncbi:hypothetical protein [Butyrivibrio sp. INlla16]|uniref:hypothetical protein n=1 Tax=Butyrivibrio sp. INlla16 TaxID=1520807 RepID=UPI000B811D48|nr:hypothetical protein [Butyrivibrio sp. INlla16]